MSRVPTHEIPVVDVAQDERKALIRAILDHMLTIRAAVLVTPSTRRYTPDAVCQLSVEALQTLYSELGITPVFALRDIIRETEELVSNGSYSPKRKKGKGTRRK